MNAAGVVDRGTELPPLPGVNDRPFLPRTNRRPGKGKVSFTHHTAVQGSYRLSEDNRCRHEKQSQQEE